MKGQMYWKRLVILLFGGWMAIWIYRSMLSPVYDEIQLTIGTQSNTAMGLIASCYFFGYTLMQIPSGLLVKRFGQKHVIIPGFLIFGMGTLVTALSSGITILYIGGVLAGIGCGTFYGAAFSLTAENVPAEKKGLSSALVNSGCSAGLILGMVGSTFLVKNRGLPWQMMSVLSLVVTVIMIVLFAVFIIRPEKTAAGAAARDQNDRAGISLLAPEMISCYILYFATCYVYYLIITWLPDFLATERGIQDALLGVVSALISVTAVPGGLYFAGLSDKQRDKKAQIITFLEISSAILVVLSMLAPNVAVLSLMLLLYGFLGKIAVDPVLISFLSDRTNRRDFPVALGVFNCCGMSSSVIAPVVTGFLKDQTGSGQGGFYIGAGILAAGTLCFIYLNRKRRIRS